MNLLALKYRVGGFYMKLSGFEKLSNTRDLGGIRTVDNKSLKYKRLIRSGRLYFASPYDITRLIHDFQLKRIVDFRNKSEIMKSPDPIIGGIDYIHCALLEEHAHSVTKDKNIDHIDFSYLMHNIEQCNFDVETKVIQDYPQLLQDEYCKEQFRKFFDILLSDVDGATLYHCSAGKDRVGVATLLLLGVLGVSEEIIVDDYIKTNYYLSERIEYYTKKARELHIDEKYIEQFPALIGVKESYIQSILDYIHAEFKTIKNYVQTSFQLTVEDIKQLKSFYLE